MVSELGATTAVVELNCSNPFIDKLTGRGTAPATGVKPAMSEITVAGWFKMS
jgi:hypothetical protein